MDGRESWLVAFAGTGPFLKAFRPQGFAISTTMWVLSEGQGRAGIPHLEPRDEAAVGLPRNSGHHRLPFWKKPCFRGPGPLNKRKSSWGGQLNWGMAPWTCL